MTKPITDGLARPMPQPDLEALLCYWEELPRQSGHAPSRDAFDPIAINAMLPRVNMVEVVRDDDEYKFRHQVVGSELVDRFQSNHIGMWFHELYTPEHLKNQLPAYLSAITTGQPTLGEIRLGDAHTELLHYWRLILPLEDSDGEVRRLLVMFSFADLAAQRNANRGTSSKGLPLHQDGRGSRV